MPKVLINSIAALAFWAVGFAFAFGGDTASGNPLIGTTGFFLQDFGDPATAFP